MKIIRLQLLTIVLLLVSQHVNGQQTFNISGLVEESGSGEILVGANVLIYKDTTDMSNPFRFGTTNQHGFYSVPGVPKGSYIFIVSSLGYEDFIEDITLSGDNRDIRRNIELVKVPIKLDEVVVAGRKKTDFSQTTSTIEVEPRLIQQLPSIGGETDIFRALQLLPGVTNSNELSTGIYVRGGSQDQNLTLIDGVNVYNPSHLGGFASTFNSDAIQNIRLIKGAFPAEYGGRLSSVLDVTTRAGTEERFIGTANVNSISTRLTIEGPLSNESTFIISGRKMYLDKILPAIPDADAFPRYNFTDFNGKVQYIVSDDDRISISGFFSNDRLLEPESSKDVGFEIGWSNSTINFTYTRIHSSTVFINTSFMYTHYDFSTLMRDKNPSEQSIDFYTESRINDLQFKTEVQVHIGEEHFLQSGFEFIYHDFNTTTSDYYVEELEYKSGFGKPVGLYEGAFYIQDEMSITKDLKTNVGARLLYYPKSNLTAIEPRFSATYYIFDRFILRSAVALAYQPMHLLSRYDVYLPTDVWYPSNEIIKPAHSLQGAIGFEATSFDRSFLFTAEAYYKEMNDLLEYKPNANFSSSTPFEDLVTLGKGEAYGLEMFLNKRLGDFTGWLGYTVSWTKRTFDLINRGEEFYPRFDRRHDISAVITYQPSENLNFGATWTYSTGQAFALPIMQYAFVDPSYPNDTQRDVYYEFSTRDAYRLPDFHKLDVSCSYKFDWLERDIELSLDIYNVYNRYNAFSKYIGYEIDEQTGERVPVLKQFTLFPFLPTIGVRFTF